MTLEQLLAFVKDKKLAPDKAIKIRTLHGDHHCAYYVEWEIKDLLVKRDGDLLITIDD